MIRIYLAVSLCLLMFSPGAWAFENPIPEIPGGRTWLPGDDVNNGGGLAEKTFLKAFASMDRYLKICLNSSACRLNQKDRQLLEQIKTALPNEGEPHGGVLFASEQNRPGFFMIDGELKIAKTGVKVGAPIFVNRDLIYSRGVDGSFQPLGLSEMVSTLVHELGHHHGELNHDYLDVLGNKVALLLQHHISESPLLPFNSNLSLIVVNDASKRSYPQLLLNIFDLQLDLTEQFAEKMFCHYQILPLPILDEINVTKEKPLGVLLHNVHWAKFSDSTQEGRYVLEGNLTKFCKEGSTFQNNNKNHKAQITFELKNLAAEGAPPKWQLKEDTLEIKDKYDPWWKFIRLPL